MDAVSRARTVPELLAALLASDPSRPRITWYGPEGDRVELAARTLANWVAKSANLLVDELDLQPGGVLALHLPVHWKSVVLDLAARSVGAAVVTGDGADADVVATTEPGSPSLAGRPPGTVLAVGLASLARRFDGELPSGAIDYAAEVAGMDDVFGAAEPSSLPPARFEAATAPRVLVRTDEPTALATVLAALQADGSVVLAHTGVPEATLAPEHATLPAPPR